MRKLIVIFIVSLAFLFVNANIWAVPSLGVATDEEYIVSPEDSFEAYQDFFASGSSTGDDEGFTIGPSGSDLHVFTNITDEDIWLLGENAYSGNELSFGGTPLVLDSLTAKNDKIAAYRGPFVGINLGTVFTGDTLNDGWKLLPSDPGPFEPSPFYVFTAPLTYTGELPIGSYLFAVADNFNGIFETGKNIADDFSPRTTSGVAVPVPSTIALLGFGMVGLVGVGVRRKMKKKED